MIRYWKVFLMTLVLAGCGPDSAPSGKQQAAAGPPAASACAAWPTWTGPWSPICKGIPACTPRSCTCRPWVPKLAT